MRYIISIADHMPGHTDSDSYIVRVLQERGPLYVLKSGIASLYRPIREQLPRRRTTFNGVTVRAARTGDDLVPWPTGHSNPDEYEQALVREIRESVRPTDEVVIVGGGWGISAVVAAEQAGERGQVTVFEGAESWVSRLRETLRLNPCPEDIDVVHAVVGDGSHLRDGSGGASVVDPDDLPECDVLVLDCEGAEISILEGMSIRPETVIVESHGLFDSPSDEVEQTLEEVGYRVESSSWAESGDLEKYCEMNDIRVVRSDLET